MLNAMRTPTAVVTGGTSGIGYHTALGLARSGHRVIVTGRDVGRAQDAAERISAETGAETDYATADLALREGVDVLARDLLGRLDRLDVLVNNAGVLAPERHTTSDGVELNFAVNVAAPVRLTRALLPVLRAAAPARVVNVTGGMPTGGLDVDDLQAERRFRPMASYTRS